MLEAVILEKKAGLRVDFITSGGSLSLSIPFCDVIVVFTSQPSCAVDFVCFVFGIGCMCAHKHHLEGNLCVFLVD